MTPKQIDTARTAYELDRLIRLGNRLRVRCSGGEYTSTIVRSDGQRHDGRGPTMMIAAAEAIAVLYDARAREAALV
ncbi:MAG: hypothetical protein ACYTAN_13760 [Planctomycetota bacterium]|jgi:hypothetical protein